ICVPTSRLRAAAADVLRAEAASVGQRRLPQGTREVAAESDSAACGPLPDDEALTDGGSASRARAAEHLDGVGRAEEARGRGCGDYLQPRPRAGAAGPPCYVCFSGRSGGGRLGLAEILRSDLFESAGAVHREEPTEILAGESARAGGSGVRIAAEMV